MVAATCPRCEGIVALHEGQPVISPTGVRLWHRHCASLARSTVDTLADPAARGALDVDCSARRADATTDPTAHRARDGQSASSRATAVIESTALVAAGDAAPQIADAAADHGARPTTDPTAHRARDGQRASSRATAVIESTALVAADDGARRADATADIESTTADGEHSLARVAARQSTPDDPLYVRLANRPLRKKRRLPTRLFGGSAAATIASIAFVSWSSAAPTTGLANLDLDPQEQVDIHVATASRELPIGKLAWVPTALELRYPMPRATDGTALDEAFPSLRDWVHPVTHSAEYVPTQHSRLFGVGRAGIDPSQARPECGEGHCGIDLDGPRGRPIVSVADGQVIRLVRSEEDNDKRSGLYVRIRHDDGTFTAYMHLDDVAENLHVGDRIMAGQYVGTLGATAVYSAPPHLHFQVEIPLHTPSTGDSTDTRYVDPSPFLARAHIIGLPGDLEDALEKPSVTPHAKRPLKPAL